MLVRHAPHVCALQPAGKAPHSLQVTSVERALDSYVTIISCRSHCFISSPCRAPKRLSLYAIFLSLVAGAGYWAYTTYVVKPSKKAPRGPITSDAPRSPAPRRTASGVNGQSTGSGYEEEWIVSCFLKRDSVLSTLVGQEVRVPRFQYRLSQRNATSMSMRRTYQDSSETRIG